jgi:hypothetical protein
MKNFAEEFRNLSSFYTKLAEDLAKIPISDDSNDGSAFVTSTLQKRALLEQIPGMNSRISQLSDDWTKCRAKLDPATQNRADEMAADAKSQAARLQELCRIHTQKLQAIHNEIRNNLVELAKGARFAKVLKPIQHNYPKFIDLSY